MLLLGCLHLECFSVKISFNVCSRQTGFAAGMSKCSNIKLDAVKNIIPSAYAKRHPEVLTDSGAHKFLKDVQHLLDVATGYKKDANLQQKGAVERLSLLVA